MIEKVPEGWQTLLVKDAFEIGRGRVISKDEIRDNFGQYPVFSSQSKNKGKMGSIRTFDFEGEYITWTTDGAYAGTVFHRSGKFNCTNVCGTLRNSGKFEINLRFAAEYLSTVAKNHVSYVGNPKLMNGTFGEIELVLPPLSEQKKIASILTSVDEVIENTQKQIDKLEDLKKATMNELLTKGIGHKEFKDSELGRIPKSWEVKRLVDIVEVQHGYQFRDYHFSAEGIPIIKIGNLTDGGDVNLSQSPTFIPREKLSEFQKFKLRKFDILMALTGGTLGKVSIFNHDFDALQNYRVGKFISQDEAYFSNDLIFWVLQSQYVQKLVDDMVNEAAQPNIGKADLETIKIPIPCLQEQKKISSVISSIDNSIKTAKKSLGQTQALKKSLMQDLLTGKVRVQVN